MTTHPIAIASAKSFGDFVIAHSVLHSIGDADSIRARIIACSHLSELKSILPGGVVVTVLDSGEDRVPAVFDVRKCGARAALRSAMSLRRRFARVERFTGEVLAFDTLGIRERFIAGSWPLSGPRSQESNIYAAYRQLLNDNDQVAPAAPRPVTRGIVRSVGIFPESRLVEKRLTSKTLAVVSQHLALAGLEARLFVLEGDAQLRHQYPKAKPIPRNFVSLAQAIRSVDALISADSLPAHLGEYFGRPVFVASPAPNEYWLPHGCFTNKRWGIFRDELSFAESLDTFLTELQTS